MEIKGKVHCFFEQSGTFKNEFIKLGIPAEDYDIQNNFGETDHVMDLFGEIDRAYENLTRQDKTRQDTVFDIINPEQDLIVAFFPCIYFCENNDMYFKGVHWNLRKKSDIEKVNIILERSEKRQYFYKLILKLYGIAKGKGLRLIIENPFSPFHYLVNNFPCEPAVIDNDRMRRGDYFNKPTQYWFINCKNTYGYSIENNKEHKTLNKQKCGKEAGICSEARSMISSDYARNWICDFVIGKNQNIGQLSFDF